MLKLETVNHTKRYSQRQQRDICNRLKKIQKRLEKTKKKKQEEIMEKTSV